MLWFALILCGGDVLALADDDVVVRDAAEQRLHARAWLARPLLTYPFADPERARRAGRVMGRYVACGQGGDWPVLALLHPNYHLCWSIDVTHTGGEVASLRGVAHTAHGDHITADALRDQSRAIATMVIRWGVPRPLVIAALAHAHALERVGAAAYAEQYRDYGGYRYWPE